MVEDEVVDALVSAVRADFPRLAHRYYLMKAKWLGLPKLSTGTAMRRCPTMMTARSPGTMRASGC